MSMTNPKVWGNTITSLRSQSLVLEKILCHSLVTNEIQRCCVCVATLDSTKFTVAFDYTELIPIDPKEVSRNVFRLYIRGGHYFRGSLISGFF